ncbi:MAG: hypothetical protein EOP37_28210 [Rubrivivax sp.]|nr:MAG: hypothetical protein EOP37_28210 [Rubrivivax sp.]
MNLTEIIARLDSADDSLCIVARRPWAPGAEAKLIALTDEYRVPVEVLADGYEYFLEVSLAVDDVIGDLRSLTVGQKVEACIFYAENDAYPDWLTRLR